MDGWLPGPCFRIGTLLEVLCVCGGGGGTSGVMSKQQAPLWKGQISAEERPEQDSMRQPPCLFHAGDDNRKMIIKLRILDKVSGNMCSYSLFAERLCTLIERTFHSDILYLEDTSSA
jgi:hypothetical protein